MHDSPLTHTATVKTTRPAHRPIPQPSTANGRIRLQQWRQQMQEQRHQGGYSVPRMPEPDAVSDLAAAKAHLSGHLPGWAGFPVHFQHEAARAFLQLARADKRRLILSQTSAARPALLLGLYPGGTRTERARNFLSATRPDFEALTYEQQFAAAREVLQQYAVVDRAVGDAA